MCMDVDLLCNKPAALNVIYTHVDASEMFLYGNNIKNHRTMEHAGVNSISNEREKETGEYVSSFSDTIAD